MPSYIIPPQNKIKMAIKNAVQIEKHTASPEHEHDHDHEHRGTFTRGVG